MLWICLVSAVPFTMTSMSPGDSEGAAGRGGGCREKGTSLGVRGIWVLVLILMSSSYMSVGKIPYLSKSQSTSREKEGVQ